MTTQQRHGTADRRPIVVNAGDPWDPTSEEAAMLVAPFGELIPSPPLLVTHLQDPVMNLGHIRADAIVREARLRASIESALYRPLPRELSYLSKLPKNIRIGLVDDQLLETEASFTSLFEFEQEEWLVINSSGMPIAGYSACRPLTPRPGYSRHKRETPSLPLLRYCSLVIGDQGSICRVASLLDKPVLPVAKLSTEGLHVTTGFDNLASAHGQLIKRRLLSAYPLRQPIEITLAQEQSNRWMPWSVAPTLSRTLFSEDDYKNSTLPQCHIIGAPLSSTPHEHLPYSTDRRLRLLFKLHRKSRKLINDPYAFFADMKIPLLSRPMKTSNGERR